MPTLISMISGKFSIEFDQGVFDNWCVYLTRNGHVRYAPRDAEYFTVLKQLNDKHGMHTIYSDFVTIYERTTNQIDSAVVQLIKVLSTKYSNDAEEIEIWLTVIYGGMIAEENKANAILKKRIKRLGMYQVLKENVDPVTAATFSKGKKWRDLDMLMKQRFF